MEGMLWFLFGLLQKDVQGDVTGGKDPDDRLTGTRGEGRQGGRWGQGGCRHLHQAGVSAFSPLLVNDDNAQAPRLAGGEAGWGAGPWGAGLMFHTLTQRREDLERSDVPGTRPVLLKSLTTALAGELSWLEH